MHFGHPERSEGPLPLCELPGVTYTLSSRARYVSSESRDNAFDFDSKVPQARHDSHKGYSHGCIEVRDFFPLLIKYAESGQTPDTLRIRVSYGSDSTATTGSTLTPLVAGEYDAPAAD